MTDVLGLGVRRCAARLLQQPPPWSCRAVSHPRQGLPGALQLLGHLLLPLLHLIHLLHLLHLIVLPLLLHHCGCWW